MLEMHDGKLRVVDDSIMGCIACGHCMMVCPEGSIQVKGRGLSPDDLLELPSKDQRASTASLNALLLSRRSVRSFSKKEVSSETIDQILQMASSAPMGVPPWDVGCTVVYGRDKVSALAEEIIKAYRRFLKLFRPWVLKLMRPFIGKKSYELFSDFVLPVARSYVKGADQGRDVLFWDAPVLLIFHHSRLCEAVDAVLPCTYAMIAAESLGLGTTIIGGTPPILQRNQKLCEQLGIPEGNQPAVSMILGYPAVSFRRSVRRRFSSVNRA
jgi:nitroreductase